MKIIAHRFAVVGQTGHCIADGLTLRQAERVAIRNCGGKRTAMETEGRGFYGCTTVRGFTDGFNGVTTIVENKE